MRIWLSALAASAVASATLHAATITWTGAVDGNWNNAGNWDLGRVVAMGDYIILPPGAPNKIQTPISVGNSSTQVNMSIQEGGYIVSNAATSLTFGTNLISVGDNTIGFGIVHQNSPYYYSSSGTLTFAVAHNTKDFHLRGNGDYLFLKAVGGGGARTMYFVTTGTARFQAGLTYYASVSGSSAKGIHIQAAGTMLVNGTQAAGSMAYGVGANGTLGGRGLVNVVSNAAYVGSGMIGVGARPNTQHPTGSGTISPGDPLVANGVGTFTMTVGDRVIFGSTANSTTGTLAIQVGDAGSGDRLVVTGNVDLSSSFDLLSLTIPGGATPAGEYTLLEFTGTRTGKFDKVWVDSVDVTARAEKNFEVGASLFTLVYEEESAGRIKLIPYLRPGTMILIM